MPAVRNTAVNFLLRVALAVCGLALIACGDSSNVHMSRAEQQFEARNYAQAIVELKYALEAANDRQETLPRARWMLGISYLRSGNTNAAAKELMHARDLGWNPNEVLPELASALLRSGQFAKVMELSTAGLDPAVTARLQVQQSLALLALGDIWTADTYIAKAAEWRPDDIELLLAKARIRDAAGDTDGALAVIERVLDAQPNRRDAWSHKGDLLSHQQRLPEAIAAFTAAIKLSPKSTEDRLKRSLINLHLQKWARVAPDLNFLLHAAPNSPLTQYLQGSVAFHKGSYAESIAALTLARPAAQQYPLILFYLAGAYLATGNEAEALSHAERQVDLNPDFAPGRILLASIYIEKSNAKDAQDTLQPVLDADPTNRLTLNLMARAMILDGKNDQALKILRRLQQMAPESAIAHFELGAAFLSAGQGEAANQHFESALALDPTLEQAWILRLQYLNGIEDFSGALAAAKDYARNNPESARAQTLLAENYLANELTDEAIAAFDKVLSLDPGDPAANHALALIEQNAGNSAASRARYQAVLAERPDYLPTLLHLAVLAAEPGNEADLVAQLEHAIETHPEALQPRIMLARYHVWENRPAKIPALFAVLPESQRQSPEVLRLIAISEVAAQQYRKALYDLARVVELEPGNTLDHHLLAAAAAGTGNLDQARAELKRAEELDRDFVPTLVALARLARADGNARRFNHYLLRLKKLAPDAPEVLRLQAVAAERDGEIERAIKHSRRVLAIAPVTTAMLELADYLRAAGRDKKALQLVQNWVSEHPADVEARMALANQLSDLGQTEEAINQFREVVKLRPQNAEALEYLTRQTRGEQPHETRELASPAVAVHPGGAEILNTLALVESKIGNQVEIQRHMRRAVAESPDSPNLLYQQAMIEAWAGNKTTAIEILRNVPGGNNAVFGKKEKAQLLLASLQNFLANVH